MMMPCSIRRRLLRPLHMALPKQRSPRPGQQSYRLMPLSPALIRKTLIFSLTNVCNEMRPLAAQRGLISSLRPCI